MSKNQAVYKTKFTMNGKTSVIETKMFAPTGHQSYSGFGAHESKSRKADRRERKLEEKRAKFYSSDW